MDTIPLAALIIGISTIAVTVLTNRRVANKDWVDELRKERDDHKRALEECVNEREAYAVRMDTMTAENNILRRENVEVYRKNEILRQQLDERGKIR